MQLLLHRRAGEHGPSGDHLVVDASHAPTAAVEKRHQREGKVVGRTTPRGRAGGNGLQDADLCPSTRLRRGGTAEDTENKPWRTQSPRCEQRHPTGWIGTANPPPRSASPHVDGGGILGGSQQDVGGSVPQSDHLVGIRFGRHRLGSGEAWRWREGCEAATFLQCCILPRAEAQGWDSTVQRCSQSGRKQPCNPSTLKITAGELCPRLLMGSPSPLQGQRSPCVCPMGPWVLCPPHPTYQSRPA